MNSKPITLYAFVSKSKEDDYYVAEGFPMCQIGIGKTKKEAVNKLYDNLVSLLELEGERKDIKVVNPEHASKKTIRGLQKAIKGEIKPFDTTNLGSIKFLSYDLGEIA